MNCAETRRLLEAHLDRELDPARDLDVESHLRTCPACTRVAENARARRTALQETLPRFTAPAGLAARICGSLRENAPEISVASRPSPTLRIFPYGQILGLAASLALAVLAGFAWGNRHARTDLLFTDAIAEHARSLQAAHLTDVVSTDQHTVKPWFAGKLDFSPPVVDLASDGFALAGGRLERLDGRPAAALVFHRRQHAINLFIWPVRQSAISSGAMQQDGYHATAWSQAGLNFLAVSEIPAEELAQFADLFRRATP